MESMTGYSFLEKTADQFSFSIEIKSLNSRYVEIFINLPRPLRNMEFMFSEIMKEHFTRGKLELTIELFNWKNKNPVSLNADVIEAYYKELSIIKARLGIKEPLRLESVITLEGITQKNNHVIFENYQTLIIESLNDAIKKTINMRKKEGSSVKSDMNKCLREILKNVFKIKVLSKKQKVDKIKKLKEKINLIYRDKVEDNRIYSEVALLAEKLDINEEIVRINDHLKKFKLMLDSRGTMGKKLDFLSQEIFREINTIASKSNSSEISQSVINVKDYLEKIREQCRNIV